MVLSFIIAADRGVTDCCFLWLLHWQVLIVLYFFMSVDYEVESLLLMASSLAGPHSSIFVMAVDIEVESLTAASYSFFTGRSLWFCISL